MDSSETRRHFLRSTAIAGSGLLLVACGRTTGNSSDTDDNEKGGEVTAVEDLMREHGVLRRALLVYTAAAAKLRGNSDSINTDALQKTAKLFQAFGEDYHEKKVEEAYVFPAVKKAGGEAGPYPDILVVHDRGREITNYILSVTQGAKLSSASPAQLAVALEWFVLMYRRYVVTEDTIVFAAWKQTMIGRT